ncbi:MAG: ATP-binding protein [Halieaceae bacterium]|nr:ATP-binding protein [Halieaceae bacterium]
MAGKARPPEVLLTSVKLGNEPVWFDVPYSELERIELDPDDYLLGLSFAAMDFRAPNRNQYRYQMVGLDQNWVELGNRNYIDFSKLPMGEYVLRIQGANPDGVWSPEGIVLDVKVHPPYYLTWYAYVVYFLIVMLFIAMFFYRQRQKTQEQLAYQMQLEEDVRARTLDLRRSNDKLQVAVEEMGRARQDAELANQAKSEFLAALSHEIRTPMHGVLGMTDLLLHSGLNDRQQNFAESAHVSANELLGLIDNILDFSKIEAGKLELEETTFGLRELLENLCYLYGELAQAKNLELNLVFNVDLRRQLYGDPVRLRQVLQNLLSNAIKFTQRGSVNLVVSEVQRKNKSVQVEFLVEDTGIGMTEETVERVFEAFSQADSSTTRQFGGTGLGLSIAKQLIDLMGGELDVKSRPGVGTAMSVELSFVESPIYTDPIHADGIEDFYAEIAAPVPETRAMFQSQLAALGMKVRECATVEEIAAVAEHERVVLVDVGCLYNSVGITLVANLAQDAHTRLLLVTPLSGQGVPPELEHLSRTTKPVRLGSLISDIQAAGAEASAAGKDETLPLLRFEKRLLLVEDIPANQQIARAMLESFGCSVAVARNGEVALEMFQQDEFDLVLMDCQMPVMDGFEATRHIRQYEMHRGSRRTPVVALTAGKTESEKERCYASGMDRILFKPYSTSDLNGLLSNYFTSSGQVERAKAPKPAAPARVDILDLKALDNIRSIESQTGGDLLAAVIENFRTDGEQKLDELRAAIGDAKALGAGAHAIKSMSLNLGAKALSEYCRRCESRWKAGEIDSAEAEVETLAGHFRDAARALEELLSQDSSPVE